MGRRNVQIRDLGNKYEITTTVTKELIMDLKCIMGLDPMEELGNLIKIEIMQELEKRITREALERIDAMNRGKQI